MKYTKLLELITQMESLDQSHWVKGYLAALKDNKLLRDQDYQVLKSHLETRINDLVAQHGW